MKIPVIFKSRSGREDVVEMEFTMTLERAKAIIALSKEIESIEWRRDRLEPITKADHEMACSSECMRLHIDPWGVPIEEINQFIREQAAPRLEEMKQTLKKLMEDEE